MSCAHCTTAPLASTRAETSRRRLPMPGMPKRRYSMVLVLAAALASCSDREIPTVAAPGRANPMLVSVPNVFTQLSPGIYHTCALRTDGTAECWGYNGNGQAPATRTALAGTFTQVSTGYN